MDEKMILQRIIGYTLVGCLWAILGIFSLAVILEYGGGIRLYQRVRYGAAVPEQPQPGVYGELSRQYQPFTVQHLHPFTLFSFPLTAEERQAIGNETVHIGAHGFRGPGPAERGDRKLAFLLGGSTAFGHFATSDATTITGYLNVKQAKYHFVNAGIPSWNTTQELHRLVDELLAYDPALIVTLDGSNDAAIALDYARKGKEYPMGTPESFDILQEFVDDLRGTTKPPPKPLYERAFPELTRHARNFLGIAPRLVRYAQSSEAIDRLAEQAARRYLMNVNIMAKTSQTFGARFLAILQPVADLHEHVAFVPDASPERAKLLHAFRAKVLAGASVLPLVDFSSLFDAYSDIIPVFDVDGEKDLSQERDIFVDHVHFTDRGNEITAEEMIALLKARGWL